VEPVPGQPLVRTLEDRDAVRQREALAHASGGQRVALVETQQARMRRFLLHHESYIVEAPAEARGNRPHRLLHEFVELLWRHLNIIVDGRERQDDQAYCGGD